MVLPVGAMKGLAVGTALAALVTLSPAADEEIEVLERRAEAYEIFQKAEDRLRALTGLKGRKLGRLEQVQWNLFMKEVVAGYQKCLELHPDYADACEALYRCHQLAEGAQPSRKRMGYLERALEIDPARYWNYLSLAGDHLALGEVEEATKLAAAVAGIHPPTAEKIRSIVAGAAVLREDEEPDEE